MWNVIGMMALVLSTSNVVHAEESKDIPNSELVAEFVDVVNTQGELIDAYVNEENQDMPAIDKQALKGMAIFEKIKKKADGDCKKSFSKTDCKKLEGAIDKLKSDSDSLQSVVDYNIEENSADGSAENACKYNNIIKNASAVLAHERKVGKVTGVVNMVTMHDAGNAVIESESRRADAVAKYKKATGKAFNFQKMCK